ncbi:MAG: TIR domain-containing protein [Oscillospiraceae bacterium]|nr:TIR domain-containing protein [Oscillospiraceae bacterium]
MERHYKAFISYRHLPMDVWAAKKLHRRIERYVIPEELRRDGQKKLGLVFRDQDELPLSSNLSASIETALDRSEFLIVICTPETVKSQWVLREIDYFLSHHDRDHVLAVLADGTPAESFPRQLTQLRGENGEVLDSIEPIAANIAAPTRAKREKLFRVESLRILAALIGCHFDALYKRELRYRRRRAALALSACALIAAAFIGMLLNRNAQIRAQLTQTQINESRALAALSEQAYGEGDYFGALRLALDALPGTGGERPYVAEAERALAGELEPYRRYALGYACSVEKDTDFANPALSADGSLLAVSDLYDTITAYDTASGAERWRVTTGRSELLCLPEAAEGLLVLGMERCALYALTDGALLWERDDLDAVNLTGVSPSGALGLQFCYNEAAPAETETVSLIGLKSGETIRTYPLGPGPGRWCAAAAFDVSETRAAFLLKEPADSTARLYLLELSDGTLRELGSALPYSPGAEAYRLHFTESGDLLLGCDSMEEPSSLRLYAQAEDYALRFTAGTEADKVTKLFLNSYPSLDLLDCRQGRIAFGSKNELFMLDAQSGGVLWQRILPGAILAARMYDNACLGLVLSDGTVSFCTDDGSLSSTLGVSCFSAGYPLACAAMRGDSYPESVFVLVPDAHRRHAAVVRWLDDPDLIQIAAFPADVGRGILLPSDTGALIACLGYDPGGRAVSCTVLDTAEGSTGETFALPMPELWRDPGAIRLTDNGLLTANGGVLDTNTRELRAAEAQAAAPEDSSLSGLSAWGDALAAALEGRTLTVRETGSGDVLCTVQAPPAAAKLLFARGDELLIVCTRTGLLNIYDARGGGLLHSSDHGDLSDLFLSSGVCYSVSEIPAEHRLLLFCDSLGRNEAVCIALDTESWDCVGVYEGAAAYLSAADRMLVCPYLDGVWLSPRRTLDDMTQKAAALLAEAKGA